MKKELVPMDLSKYAKDELTIEQDLIETLGDDGIESEPERTMAYVAETLRIMKNFPPFDDSAIASREIEIVFSRWMPRMNEWFCYGFVLYDGALDPEEYTVRQWLWKTCFREQWKRGFCIRFESVAGAEALIKNLREWEEIERMAKKVHGDHNSQEG